VERLRRAIDLRFDLRTALLPLAELDLILGHLREAESLAVELEDPHRLGQLLVYMTGQRYLMGAYADALEYGRRALAITESGRDFNLSISTHTYLGQVHHARGAYREAVPLFKHNVDVLVGDLAHERFGLPQLPSVHSRTCLVWSLAELGEFAEGAVRGQEAIEIAQAVDQPLSLTVALSGPGVLYVRQGDLARAVPLLERAVELSQTWSIPLWFPRVASALGLAHAMAGRHAEALALLEAAVEQSAAMRLQGGHSLLLTCLAEGHLLAGRTDRALDVAALALDLARRHRERGYEAWALRLSAEALRRAEPERHDEARARAEDALALAETLGMRPLVAHCRLELGRAGRTRGSDDKALGHLEAARAEFAQLGMAHHRELVEADLRSG
jgi:tetratricopeptide (TPR) repeat protein